MFKMRMLYSGHSKHIVGCVYTYVLAHTHIHTIKVVDKAELIKHEKNNSLQLKPIGTKFRFCAER